MPVAICLDCEAEVYVDSDSRPGDFVICEECGAEFEVAGLDPLELQPVDGDYDEDDDEDIDFGGAISVREESNSMHQAYVGEIRMFAGDFPPAGWARCDGQELMIAENEILFNLIGTTYGGDGMNTFALPNLKGRTPMHPGLHGRIGETSVAGFDDRRSETHFSAPAAPSAPGYLPLTFIISLYGVFPSRDGGIAVEPFVGEGRVFAFNFPPGGWAECNGQLLPINQNEALFALLGTSYGGNGQTNFALPNLQSGTPMHRDHCQVGETLAGGSSASVPDSTIDFLNLTHCIALYGIFPSYN